MPRREHRLRPRFVVRETGEAWKAGRAERATELQFLPVDRLLVTLAAAPEWLAGLERVRRGDDSAESMAGRYVWRESRPRRVVAEIIWRVVATPAELIAATLAVGERAFGVEALPDESGPREWPHDASRLDVAAAMLAARGAGRCARLVTRRLPDHRTEVSICRAVIAGDGPRRSYCSTHEPRTERDERMGRADREAIVALLNAVGDALWVD